MKLEHFLTLYTKINSKFTFLSYIILHLLKNVNFYSFIVSGHLNVRPETITLLEENIVRIHNKNQSKILYDPPPRVREIKTKVNKWDLIKLKYIHIHTHIYIYIYI